MPAIHNDTRCRRAVNRAPARRTARRPAPWRTARPLLSPPSWETRFRTWPASIAGEHGEWTKDYIEAAQIAQEEGFPKAAATFRQIAEAEKSHERRFAALKANLEKNEVFRKGAKKQWRCRNCGRVIEGEEAPKSCPTCQHPQSFFELLAENY